MFGWQKQPQETTVALVGVGNRGALYGDLVHAAAGARVVALAEPRVERRASATARYGLAGGAAHHDWRSLLAERRLADAVVIATPDPLHVEPAVRALELGYHVLLEKPIATRADDVEALARAARSAGTTVTVAHVLRHAPFFVRLKRLLDDGRVGRVVTIQHTEGIGSWHFAHSYVRGNWRTTREAAPMLLAKACHDLDILRWLAGAACERVASEGSLLHFRTEEAPAGAGERCLDCGVERECPYSAVRFYLERHRDHHGWPVSVLSDDTSLQGRVRALQEGPYGRCVYRCDNDVADHQVVTLRFANGVAASLTVSAFTLQNSRSIRVMGTRGEISGDFLEGRLEVRDFLTGEREEIQGTSEDGSAAAGRHGGGDEALVGDWLERLAALRSGGVVREGVSSLEASLESHRMAFAAEIARHEGRVVSLVSSDGRNESGRVDDLERGLAEGARTGEPAA